jgi:hypothetical protein
VQNAHCNYPLPMVLLYHQGREREVAIMENTYFVVGLATAPANVKNFGRHHNYIFGDIRSAYKFARRSTKAGVLYSDATITKATRHNNGFAPTTYELLLCLHNMIF